MVAEQKIVRWQGLNGTDREHLVLDIDEQRVRGESVFISAPAHPDAEHPAFAINYRIELGPDWVVREYRARVIGTSNELIIKKNTQNQWCDQSGSVLPELSGTIDLDLSISPFTNSLPINRLNLQKGQSSDIQVAYVRFPELHVFSDVQRYTCIEPKKKYLFESVDTDFRAEIEVDKDGLVLHYPGFFARM